jgi:P27 family predicted phage terminase small subunit
MPRRPIPTALKIIRGNPGKRKLNQHEPKPVGDLAGPPEHFDAEMADVWNYAITNAPPGLLKKIDSAILETWCTAHVLHRRAAREVSKFGMLMKAPVTGLPIQSPFLPVVNKQALIMMRACDHLGFSPASRTRIATGEGLTGTSDWDAITRTG